MKAYKGTQNWLQSFLISALYGGKWSVSRPGRLTSRGEPRYQLNRGRAVLTDGLDNPEEEKSFAADPSGHAV